jgi:hypothetical protein
MSCPVCPCPACVAARQQPYMNYQIPNVPWSNGTPVQPIPSHYGTPVQPIPSHYGTPVQPIPSHYWTCSMCGAPVSGIGHSCHGLPGNSLGA